MEVIIFKNPNGFGSIKRLQGNRYRPYAFFLSINGKQKPVAYFTNYMEAINYQNYYLQQNLRINHSTHDCRHTVQNVTEGYTHKTMEELQKTIELLT